MEINNDIKLLHALEDDLFDDDLSNWVFIEAFLDEYYEPIPIHQRYPLSLTMH